MKLFSRFVFPAGLALLVLTGCSDDAGKPAAVVMTDVALGHYCQMYVMDHAGPKAQIHLKGMDDPFWFGQVSDAVAFMQDPDRESDIVAIYVNDMGKAASWGEPGRDNWVEAEKAVYVISSKQMGGMGTPEAIPYGSKADAEALVSREGGTIVQLAEIPEAYVRSAESVDRDAVGSVAKSGD